MRGCDECLFPVAASGEHDDVGSMLEQLQLEGDTNILLRYPARYSSRDSPASYQAATLIGRSREMPATSEVRSVAGSTSCRLHQAYGRLSCGCTGSMRRQCCPNASARPLRQAQHDRTSGLRKEIFCHSIDTCNRRGHRCSREKISRDYGSSPEHT